MMAIMVNCYDNDDYDNHDDDDYDYHDNDDYDNHDYDKITHLNNNKPRSAQLIVI
jgi:hypothetical protein